MTTTLRDARTRRGISQGDLGRRLGVTAAAVTQYERNEAVGTIRVATLARALRTLDEELLLSSRPSSPTYDPAPIRVLSGRARGVERARFRSRRIRVAIVSADALLEGSPLSYSDLALVADRVTVSGHPRAAILRAREIRDGYDRVLRGADPVAPTPRGDLVPDSSIEDPAERAFELFGRAVLAGGNPVETRWALYAELLRNGVDLPLLHPANRDEYDAGLASLRETGSLDEIAGLLVRAYGEDD